MDAKRLRRLRTELAQFADRLLPDNLGNRTRRRWAEVYLRGLLLDGDRKSIQPLAERLQEVDQADQDYEQALQQLVNDSPWDDRPVRDRLAQQVVATVGTGGFVILDDTGFPKQGPHSVGVARQYTGTLGKVANCQVAVTLQYATDREVFVLDAALFLTEAWGQDRERLRAAGVPDGVGYQPKWRLALDLLAQARTNGVAGTVLADSAFGDVTAFRQELDQERWPYAVQIGSTLVVVAADQDFGSVPPYRGVGRPPTRPAQVRPGAKATSVQAWAQARADDFRKVTWWEGSKGKLASRFAAWRVRPAHRLSAGQEPLSACWLLVEWPAGEAAPTKYFFSNLPPRTSLRQLVRTAKGRWWIEHSYKELKEELGLDHYEGRRWRGWHHHVTLVLLAYAFLVCRRRSRRGKKGVPT
jgi:SRSO17 transposase